MKLITRRPEYYRLKDERQAAVRKPGAGRLPNWNRSSGQAIVIVALVLTVLILFVGLAVDVGFLMSKRSKLQSAVDSAALSAAQILYGGTQSAATIKAQQIVEASGVPSNTLTTSLAVSFPGTNQVYVGAVQRIDTFFMRLVPAFAFVDISAEATADATSFAEIQAKPYGDPGVVNQLNLMVWGALARRHNGDAYSPNYMPSSIGAEITNTEHAKQPYGYLFRIDVPTDYPDDELVVQIFDPDTYNRTDWPSPAPTVLWPSPTPTPSANNYAYCATSNNNCTTGGVREDPGLRLNAFPNGLPAFWRVDELRARYYETSNAYDSNKATTTQYTLWHFDPRITSAFEDPYDLSDIPGGGPIATFTVHDDSRYDLRWYRPPGFQVTLSDYEQEANGKYYFYIYVQGIAGSSENNYDLRTGPPPSNPWQTCTDLPSTSYNSPCYVNDLYYRDREDWEDGGAVIFAKRALPLNLDTGEGFPVILAQISKNASGQTLGVRHFDQDCNGGGCGTVMRYQMQKCGSTDLSDDDSWEDVGVGYVGGNDTWTDGTHSEPEPVKIPIEGSAEYNTFFTNGATTCDTSWLRIYRYPSYSQDSTVWELPFLRPRLIK